MSKRTAILKQAKELLAELEYKPPKWECVICNENDIESIQEQKRDIDYLVIVKTYDDS